MGSTAWCAIIWAAIPESGHVFLFTNARRNRLKLVVYDGSGLWVCSKKIRRRLFSVAGSGQHGEENRAES